MSFINSKKGFFSTSNIEEYALKFFDRDMRKQSGYGILDVRFTFPTSKNSLCHLLSNVIIPTINLKSKCEKWEKNASLAFFPHFMLCWAQIKIIFNCGIICVRDFKKPK